jgi:hypothetical protein
MQKRPIPSSFSHSHFFSFKHIFSLWTKRNYYYSFLISHLLSHFFSIPHLYLTHTKSHDQETIRAQWVTISIIYPHIFFFSTIHTFIDSDLNKALRSCHQCCYCSHRFSLPLSHSRIFNSSCLLKAQLLIIASLLLCWSFCLELKRSVRERESDSPTTVNAKQRWKIIATKSTHIMCVMN